MQPPPAVWLVVVTMQLIRQPGQLDADGSVGRRSLAAATVIQYLVAPLMVDQLKVGVTGMFVTPSVGEMSCGEGSNCGAVPESAICATANVRAPRSVPSGFAGTNWTFAVAVVP